jgi:hypothetical protein
VAIRPPAGFVGVFDGGLAVPCYEVVRNASTQLRQPMADLEQTPRTQARLLADGPQGDAMEIMHRGRHGDELVPRETLGEDGRRRRLEGASAARAIVRRQPIEDPFGFHRAAIQAQPAVSALLFQERVAVRAPLADLGRDLHHSLGLAGIKGLATDSQVSQPRAFALGLLGRRNVSLDRPLVRRVAEPKKPLDGLPLLVAELLPKALDLLGEPTNLSLLLQTFGTPLHRHCHFRHEHSCEPPCGGHTGTVAPRPIAGKHAAPGAKI